MRAYNVAWNYYRGMSEPEIEAEIRRDTVWQRPSWKLGERHGPIPGMRDPFGLYNGKEHIDGARRSNGHAALFANRTNRTPRRSGGIRNETVHSNDG